MLSCISLGFGEYSMELAQLVTGGRKTYGNVVMGGLRRDMTNHEIKKGLEIIIT